MQRRLRSVRRSHGLYRGRRALAQLGDQPTVKAGRSRTASTLSSVPRSSQERRCAFVVVDLKGKHFGRASGVVLSAAIGCAVDV